jgi:hypothetical protein
MAEANSERKTMRIKIAYRDQTLSMCHHTIKVFGGNNGIWYSGDTTSLPVEIQITISGDIKKEFYIIIGVENKFNDECIYQSQRQTFNINNLSNEVEVFQVESNDRSFF